MLMLPARRYIDTTVMVPNLLGLENICRIGHEFPCLDKYYSLITSDLIYLFRNVLINIVTFVKFLSIVESFSTRALNFRESDENKLR